MKDNIFLSDSNNFIKKHIIVAHLCGLKAHFAVSACFILATTGTTWYNFFVYVVIVVLVVVCLLFIGRGEATGMLPLQDGAYKDSLLFVPRTSMRQSYDIFAKWQREWGIFLR